MNPIDDEFDKDQIELIECLPIFELEKKVRATPELNVSRYKAMSQLTKYSDARPGTTLPAASSSANNPQPWSQFQFAGNMRGNRNTGYSQLGFRSKLSSI